MIDLVVAESRPSSIHVQYAYAAATAHSTAQASVAAEDTRSHERSKSHPTALRGSASRPPRGLTSRPARAQPTPQLGHTELLLKPMAAPDRFRTATATGRPGFASDISGTMAALSWRSELGGFVAPEHARVGRMDGAEIREKLKQNTLPTGTDGDVTEKTRLQRHFAMQALTRVAKKDIKSSRSPRRKIQNAQRAADHVEALTALILSERTANDDARRAQAEAAAKAAHAAARHAGVIDSVRRPTTADELLGASSRPSQRRVSRGPQPRQQRKPRKIEPFEIRGSEKRPWTGHERGEHVPLGHAYMKNGGHQDRTRPYVRPGDQTVSRTSSMSTNARVRQSAEYLSNQRERDLRYGGFRRVKDASRPHTPEFWFKQSLDGSRIDIAAAGVFSRDAAAAAAPHRCLIRTKAINARRGSILDRTTDVGSMMDMGALGISHDTENALPASDHARVVNASRPNTSDNTVPRSAVRRVGSYHAGLSENDEGWLVNQMTSERDFTLCKDPFLEYA